MPAELNQHSPRGLEKTFNSSGGFQQGFPPYLFEPAETKGRGNQTKTNLYLENNMQNRNLVNKTHATLLTTVAVFWTLFSMNSYAGSADAVANNSPTPAVFQAAGPNTASIQSTVDAFRAALGTPVNLNNPGPLTVGRREINWDGGSPAVIATTDPVTPFNLFLNTRGAQFTTPGTGLSQATPAGLADLFKNPSYATIFTTFSPSRLFTPVGSKITNATFFIPGSNGLSPALVSGFGVVFTDVDQPDGDKTKPSTQIEYFDAKGKLLFQSSIPGSPGDRSLSFFGIKFDDARIASVRITTDRAAGANDARNNDIVMMDDFIYGEPQGAH